MKVAPRPAASIAPTATTTPTAATEAPKAAEQVGGGWVAKSAAPTRAAAATPSSPRDVVESFYKAFETKDVSAMEQLYAPNVKFKDAIFSFDDRAGTANMWRGLFKTDPNAKLKFSVDSVNGDTVKGHWVADYHLGNRPVHNEVSTTMKVSNGKITEHTDDFSWDKWAPQAFPAGKLFTLPGLDRLAKGLVRAFLS